MRVSRSHVVVAAAAFAIGATGSATAAKLITGKQIQDGTITSKDLSKSLRAQLKLAGKPGPAGPQGSPGTPGTPGAQGSQGPAGSTADVMSTVLANDGAGKGLDADMLDGLDSTSLVARSGSTMTGPLRVATGSPTSPSIGFAGDTDSGFFSSAEGELRWSTNGVTRLIAGFGGLEVTGGYLTLPARTALPAASDCDIADEFGRMLIYLNGTAGAELWICDNDVSASAGFQPGWIIK